MLEGCRRPIGHPMLIDQSINQPTNQPTNQPINQPTNNVLA